MSFDKGRADFCIFGAGPAGLTLAESLASKGASVLLVEQGKVFSEASRGKLIGERLEQLRGRDMDFDHDNTSTLVNPPVVGENYNYMSLAAVGGTSLHWDGHTPRPTEEDMRVRSLFDYGRDWPISYKELEPYLLKAEYQMGISGNDDNPYASFRSGNFPMPAMPQSYFESELLTPAMKKLGWAAHSRPNAVASKPYRGRSGCMGCRACTVCPSGARYAADRVSLQPFLGAEHSKLMVGRKLKRVVLGKKEQSVEACITVDESGNETSLTAKHYILALGGVETPRMLMLSSHPKHPGGLGNNGGQLGLGFSDHPMTFMRYILNKKTGKCLGFPGVNTDHFRDRGNTKGAGTFSLNLKPDRDYVPTDELIARVTDKGRFSLELLREMMPRLVLGWPIHEHTGPGTLSLSKDKNDAFGDPIAKIDISLSDRDREGFALRYKASALLGDAMGVDSHFSQFPEDFQFWGSHPSGGSAMGKTPDTGACDSNLGVMGVSNLSIVSSSVFPHGGAFNPTLSIVALALRLSDHLRPAK